MEIEYGKAKDFIHKLFKCALLTFSIHIHLASPYAHPLISFVLT